MFCFACITPTRLSEMGNRVSSGNVEGNIFAPAAREENIYDHSYPQPPPTRPPAPLVPLPNLPSSHLPPSAVKRSMTISHRTREKQTDSSPQVRIPFILPQYLTTILISRVRCFVCVVTFYKRGLFTLISGVRQDWGYLVVVGRGYVQYKCSGD